MSNIILNRFLNYVSFNTRSNPESGQTPSSEGQMVFSKHLANELLEIGLTDVKLDDWGYLTATVPSNTTTNTPTIGLIAHVDTSPDFNGKDIKPLITTNYNGGDILLNPEENIVLSPTLSPELKKYIGQTIITTDGTTLLGADDKAGVAEIVTAMEYIINHPEIEHGTLRICFTPDEEIGEGADHFNVADFGAEFAYTIDGGEIGELEFENFNAAGAKVIIRGLNIHPGYGFGRMINAQLVAHRFITLLPNETPSNTTGYDGFFHLTSSAGDVELFEMHFIIRDFDKEHFDQRIVNLTEIAEKINQEYQKEIVMVEVTPQYQNMRKMIEPVMHIVERAKQAMERSGVEPKIKPIRGGTDGARLSYMGLPCPNIFAGGHNFHGRYEFIPLESMQKAVAVIVELVRI